MKILLKNPEFDNDLGLFYSKIFNFRVENDYDDVPGLAKEFVEGLYTQSKYFIEEISKYINQNTSQQ